MSLSIEVVDSQETHDSYSVHFFSDRIDTLVTHDPETAADWVSFTEQIHRSRLDRLIVGLDTEWRPSYGRQQNPVAILQICVGRRCLIFQILRSEAIPDELREFLANEEYTFVGVGIKDDVERLEEDHGIFVSGRTVDLRRLAAEVYGDNSMKNYGLKDLTRSVLGRSIEKPRWVTMSRWDNPWLNHGQVQYACIDAYVSFEIGRTLNASAN